jgi:O-acetylhomoserine (thiol)-lyase
VVPRPRINTSFDAPHSRWNDIPRSHWDAAGLRVLAESGRAGVHLATSADGFRIVYFQGHPEYERNSLLKEYKREVGRFIAGELAAPRPIRALPRRGGRAGRGLHCTPPGRTRRTASLEPTFPEEPSMTTSRTPGATRGGLFNNWLGLVYQLTGLDRHEPFMPGGPADPLGLVGYPRPCPSDALTLQSESGAPMKDETIAIHAGYQSEPTTHSVAVPIYQTVAYEFDSAKHGADLFNLEVAGNIYTRIMNPTTDVLEKRMAELEGGIAGLALSAGSAAINYAILTIAKAGSNDRLGAAALRRHLHALRAHAPGAGYRRALRHGRHASGPRAAHRDKTAASLESIGNPAGNVADIEAIAEMAHRHGVPVIADATVTPPTITKSIAHGVDIVVHSMTKYIGGHGNSLGGMIVDSGNFPWAEHPDKYPMLTEPEPAYHGVVYTEAFGPAAYIARTRTVPLRNTGSAISPLNAFLIIQGLETLALRMERHTANAMAVAEYLKGHDRVAWVTMGLPDRLRAGAEAPAADRRVS